MYLVDFVTDDDLYDGLRDVCLELGVPAWQGLERLSIRNVIYYQSIQQTS